DQLGLGMYDLIVTLFDGSLPELSLIRQQLARPANLHGQGGERVLPLGAELHDSGAKFAEGGQRLHMGRREHSGSSRLAESHRWVSQSLTGIYTSFARERS